MDSFTQDLLMSAIQDENAGAKALANYMFREIVEDIHAEGKITDEEMEQLNKDACNRAALFWNEIMSNQGLRAAFLVEATNSLNWDPPVMTAELEKKRDYYFEVGVELRELRKNNKKK